MVHDFPGNLNSLNQEAAQILGGITRIIFEHTLLPVFSPFQSERTIADAADTMRSPLQKT